MCRISVPRHRALRGTRSARSVKSRTSRDFFLEMPTERHNEASRTGNCHFLPSSYPRRHEATWYTVTSLEGRTQAAGAGTLISQGTMLSMGQTPGGDLSHCAGFLTLWCQNPGKVPPATAHRQDPVSIVTVGDKSQPNPSLVMCRMARVVITKCPACLTRKLIGPPLPLLLVSSCNPIYVMESSC